MDFDKLLSYLEVDSNKDVNLKNIERYIDELVSIELDTKGEQEDFIVDFKNVVVKRLGIFSDCRYNDYQPGYFAVLDGIAKRKYELRQSLQLSDQQQVYMISSEIKNSEQMLQKLVSIEDVTIRLHGITNQLQLERISHQVDRLHYNLQQGRITFEEFQYQQEKIQAIKSWYDYSELMRQVFTEEIVIDNECWVVRRLKNKGDILAHQYALYQDYIYDTKALLLLEKEQIEKDYLENWLCFSTVDSENNVARDSEQEMLSHHIQKLKAKGLEFFQQTMQGIVCDYSNTEPYHNLVTMISRENKCPSYQKQLFSKL